MSRELAKTRIKKNFILLIQSEELHQIKVAHLCKLSQVNRSTFYAHYLDIYDLSEQLTIEIEDKYLYMVNLKNDQVTLEEGFTELFNEVKNNPQLYNAYFKINPNKALIFKERTAADLSNQSHLLKYNSLFFRSGITAVVKLWLENNCQESIEEMVTLLLNKYNY